MDKLPVRTELGRQSCLPLPSFYCAEMQFYNSTVDLKYRTQNYFQATNLKSCILVLYIHTKSQYFSLNFLECLHSNFSRDNIANNSIIVMGHFENVSFN